METAGTVLSMRVEGLTKEELAAVDEAIDGGRLSAGSASAAGQGNDDGRVVYRGGESPLYIYLVHR